MAFSTDMFERDIIQKQNAYLKLLYLTQDKVEAQVGHHPKHIYDFQCTKSNPKEHTINQRQVQPQVQIQHNNSWKVSTKHPIYQTVIKQAVFIQLIKCSYIKYNSLTIYMIIVDAILFMVVVGVLHYYKSNHPNFLFFCKGAVLFLPPDQQQKQKQMKGSKSTNKNKVQEDNQVSVIQVEYNQVKTYPFCTEYQRIAMTIVALLVFYFLRAALHFILPQISLLPFYIISAILMYTVKVSVDIFMVSSYKSKTCFTIAFLLNAFFLFLALTLGSLQGIYDTTLQFISQDYAKHLEIILGNSNINWINQHTVLFVVVFLNFFITLASIPSIVKFGNWYSNTLKEIYNQQGQGQQQSVQKLSSKSGQSVNQTQGKIRQHSKNTISLLNYYLVATLVFLFLSHRYLLTFLPQLLVDVLRISFFTASVTIILYTAKDAVQFNGAFAYQYILAYFKQKSTQGRLALRRKIVPYIYHIWYHFHQLMIRIMIPILLIILLVNWKYFSPSHLLQQRHVSQRQINYDIQCSINYNQIELVRNVYKCPIKSYKMMGEENDLVRGYVISGVVTGQGVKQPPSQLQDKVLEYGLIKRQFMVEFTELLLWYSNITVYGMTVVYVLFLRKAVYEI